MISPFTFLKILTHCSTRGLTNPDVTTRATPNEENRALMITQPSSNAHTVQLIAAMYTRQLKCNHIPFYFDSSSVIRHFIEKCHCYDPPKPPPN